MVTQISSPSFIHRQVEIKGVTQDPKLVAGRGLKYGALDLKIKDPFSLGFLEKCCLPGNRWLQGTVSSTSSWKLSNYRLDDSGVGLLMGAFKQLRCWIRSSLRCPLGSRF